VDLQSEEVNHLDFKVYLQPAAMSPCTCIPSVSLDPIPLLPYCSVAFPPIAFFCSPSPVSCLGSASFHFSCWYLGTRRAGYTALTMLPLTPSTDHE